MSGMRKKKVTIYTIYTIYTIHYIFTIYTLWPVSMHKHWQYLSMQTQKTHWFQQTQLFPKSMKLACGAFDVRKR